MSSDTSLSPAQIQELSAHYAAACKGDKTRALLMALDDGYDFVRVVSLMGDDGVRISFNDILEGFIDRGHITEKGRAYLRGGADA